MHAYIHMCTCLRTRGWEVGVCILDLNRRSNIPSHPAAAALQVHYAHYLCLQYSEPSARTVSKDTKAAFTRALALLPVPNPGYLK